MFKTKALLLSISLTLFGGFSAQADAAGQNIARFNSQAASDSFCQSHNCLAQFSIPDQYVGPKIYYFAIYTD